MPSMIKGKILFYNSTNGTGLVITQEKKKYPFSVEQWDDFETMPTLGLSVLCSVQDDKIVTIKTTDKSTEKQLSKELLKDPETLEKVELPQKDLKEVISESLAKKQVMTPQKHKSSSLNDIETELSKLLNRSSGNLDFLDKKISLTADIYSSIKIYIDEVDIHLKKRMNYKKVDGRLDYLLAKRFLWTTYNNLKDIDRTIITNRIASVRKDLEFMDKLHENFTKRTTSPAVAFEELFLTVQTEYRSVKSFTRATTEKLHYLQKQEEILKNKRENKNNLIAETKDKKLRAKLNEELKTLNGTYVDIVHMMARVQEIQNINLKRLKDFETKYQEEFYKNFKKEAKKYKDIILDILNAQAFFLDFSLWKEAKISNDIRVYFKKLSIDVELNTKTYLKYYLSTLDESKSSEASKELYTLYDHLNDIYKEYILVITSSAQDAMEYEQAIKGIDNSYNVKSFINEINCVKFAMMYTIKAIVVEEKLQKTNADIFLDYYHSHILSKPKILYIGNNIPTPSSIYHIDKRLPLNTYPRAVASGVKDILTIVH